MKTMLKSQEQQVLESCLTDNFKKAETKVISVLDLARPMFLGNKEILDKYFTNQNGQACFNFRLPKVSKEEYRLWAELEEIKGKTVPAFEDATQYYLNKCLMKTLNRDFKFKIDLKGYKDDERRFLYVSEGTQIESEEDWFKEDNDIYVEPAKTSLDVDTYTSLYNVLYKALKNRLVMVLNLDTVVPILENIRDYQMAFGNVTLEMNNTLQAVANRIRKILEDPEVDKWLKSGVNDLVAFAGTTSEEAKDYVETYRKVLRQISGCDKGESLDYMYEIIHNNIDPYEGMIIANSEISEFED